LKTTLFYISAYGLLQIEFSEEGHRPKYKTVLFFKSQKKYLRYGDPPMLRGKVAAYSKQGQAYQCDGGNYC